VGGRNDCHTTQTVSVLAAIGDLSREKQPIVADSGEPDAIGFDGKKLLNTLVRVRTAVQRVANDRLRSYI
jgi:hypothetical protein